MPTSIEVPAVAETSIPDLTGHDECDVCSKQAYVRVEIAPSRYLNFCGHHYRRHEPALVKYRKLDSRSELGGMYA